MNFFIILASIFLLIGCKDNDSSDNDSSLYEPVFIPRVSYSRSSEGLSGVWDSPCALSKEIPGFETAKSTYVISRNNDTIKKIFRLYKGTACQGEKTTLTFVMSCDDNGTKIVESGVVVRKIHCSKDRFWRESESEELVKFDKKIDFKIILYQSETDSLNSNINIDSSVYPSTINWEFPYYRRIIPAPIDLGSM